MYEYSYHKHVHRSIGENQGSVRVFMTGNQTLDGEVPVIFIYKQQTDDNKRYRIKQSAV